MVDLLFEDAELAAVYDLFAPPGRRADFSFYLPMVMAAESVLDVGCGTGAMLHTAREMGHDGWLCGLDPADGMLRQASKRSDIEWASGEPGEVSFRSEFDLAVMTGHAFQVLTDDDEVRSALAGIKSALKPTGRFAFETRNPADRAWERWGVEYSGEVENAAGETIRSRCEVDEPIQGDLVRFSHTFTSLEWPEPRVSKSVLRFLDVDSLDWFLAEAGFEVERRFGDWDRSALLANSPEIITIARMA